MALYRKVFIFAWSVVQVFCLHLHIDEFYSISFVPKDIIIKHSLNDLGAVSYNFTVKEHFPGKLLMHLFVRKLDDIPGGNNVMTMIKLKNLDFCKTLDSLRNMTLDEDQSESVLQSTFLLACPVSPGFYFIDQGYLEESLVPVRLQVGRYFVQFELIQVYEEVIKLLNCKMKISKLEEKKKENVDSGTEVDDNEAEDDKTENSKVEKSVTKNKDGEIEDNKTQDDKDKDSVPENNTTEDDKVEDSEELI